jgi:hypothetical protein
MQTVAWMAFSDSTHFSDKISYKILFISSYGLKDMIFTRFAQNLPLFRQPKTTGTLLTEVELDRGADAWGRDR